MKFSKPSTVNYEEVFFREQHVRVSPASVSEQEYWDEWDIDNDIPAGYCICGRKDCADEYVHWSSGF